MIIFVPGMRMTLRFNRSATAYTATSVLPIASFLVLFVAAHGSDLPADIEAALNTAGTNRPQIEAALAKAQTNQEQGMQFLVANMPEADLRTLSADYLQ